MEEILDLYEEAYDPLRPVVCFDERSWQLNRRREGSSADEAGAHRTLRLGVRAGRPLLGLDELRALSGWRELVVTERRRKKLR
jgi:hypothetical protein